MTSANARQIAARVEDLLADASSIESFSAPDGKSGSAMSRVTIDGRAFVLKHLDHRTDWIMRITGDLACRPVVMWRSGLLDRLPAAIDHTIVAAAWDGVAGAILMRDAGDAMIPEGDGIVDRTQHLRFLDHMAQMHAAFLGWRDELGLTPLWHRYLAFHDPTLPETERRLGGDAAVPTRFVPEGWRRFPERAPSAARVVMPLLRDPTPLLRALASTPATLIHGDWKMGNLGTHPDGRTVLIDWAVPGEAPPCADLAWYLSLNRARLPQSKEDAIAAYRESLERHGVDTGPWWDRQLALCMLGALVQFGWEKALGDGDEHTEELAWWEARAVEGASALA